MTNRQMLEASKQRDAALDDGATLPIIRITGLPVLTGNKSKMVINTNTYYLF